MELKFMGTEGQERLAREVLDLANCAEVFKETIRAIIRLIKQRTGFEAVGIRLREGDDFPYFDCDGFSEDFLRTERYLCARSEDGRLLRDANGQPVLECMCGNILRGRTDAAHSFFTKGGSFWSNSTTKLLATTTDKDRQARTRNRCNAEGYESVALIPLRAAGETMGLLQLNDRRPDRFTPESIHFFEGLGASLGMAIARKHTEDRILHLNRLLRTICKVNQKIVHERNGDVLIQAVCELLVAPLGYDAAIIILTDETGKPRAHAHAGRDGTFQLLEKRLAEGYLPSCCNRARLREGAHCVRTHEGSCVGCPVAAAWPEHVTMTVNLKQAGKDYGYLMLLLPASRNIGADETELVTEVAADVAFALHGIEQERLRKRAEEELRQSEHEKALILDNAAEIISFHDTDQNIRWANEAYQKATGLSLPKLRGKKCCDVWRLGKICDGCPVTMALKTGKTHTAELTPQNQPHWPPGQGSWMVSAAPVRDEKGRIIGAIEMAFDITERKRMEEDLRKSNLELQDALKQMREMQEQLIQHERLSALGHMASGIAHDFNNALVPVLGYVELLLARPYLLDNREATIDMLKLVRGGTLNAAETVRRMREFYRPMDLSEREPVDMSGVILNAVALTQPKWKEEMMARSIAIEVRTEIEPMPPLPGDEHELTRLMVNLIFNAVDAMPSGGCITIRLYPHPAGRHAVIEVHDTGVGMSEEVKRKCFDPFFTTKGGRGVGLGLSVSSGIVQRHNGNIDVRSEPGKGTTFTVTLPMKEVQFPETLDDEKSLPESLPQLRSLHVLLVDEDEASRILLSRYLEADGHTAKLAGNGLEGLSTFEAGHFDAVILDRAMPGMSGDELAAAIKKRSPDTPVLMLTGFGYLMWARCEHPAGVDMVISKPPTMDDLRRALAAVVGYHAPQSGQSAGT